MFKYFCDHCGKELLKEEIRARTFSFSGVYEVNPQIDLNINIHYSLDDSKKELCNYCLIDSTISFLRSLDDRIEEKK